MLSIKELAARDDVSRAAVSKSVKRLLKNTPDTPLERGSQGQVLRVSLAHYDHFRAQFLNPCKIGPPLQRITTAAPGTTVDRTVSFEEARRQCAWLAYERGKIEALRDSGELLDKDAVADLALSIGRTIHRTISRLPNAADEMALALSEQGLHGVRIALQRLAADMCSQVEGVIALPSQIQNSRAIDASAALLP